MRFLARFTFLESLLDTLEHDFSSGTFYVSKAWRPLYNDLVNREYTNDLWGIS
jgi:hypothetical protein